MIPALPVFALLVYAVIGQPGYAGQPFHNLQKARWAKDPATLTPAEQILLLEQVAKTTPNDTTAKRHLARLYLDQNRLPEAVYLLQPLLSQLPNDADVYAHYAEARMKASAGQIDDAALMAIKHALNVAPDHVKGRLFLALHAIQTDKYTEAEKLLLALQSDLSSDDPKQAMITGLLGMIRGGQTP